MLYEYDGKRPVVGRETYVSETAQVIGDVTIGDNCYIGHGAILRGDYCSIVIGNGTAVEEGVIVHAPPNLQCLIGERVTIGHGAVIHAASIGDLCVIGMNSIVSVFCQVGSKSIVAEGSVVKMRQVIPEGVVAGGNPARILRNISQKDIDFWRPGKEIYINLAKNYLAKGGIIPMK